MKSNSFRIYYLRFVLIVIHAFCDFINISSVLGYLLKRGVDRNGMLFYYCICIFSIRPPDISILIIRVPGIIDAEM